VTITWSLLADFDRDGSFEFDLTPYIDSPGMSPRISRGVGRDGRPRASRLTLRLANRDGIFTPENSSSALYGKLDPGAPVQLTATHLAVSYTVWTGYAMRWRVTFPHGEESVAALECEDLFWFLQNGDPVNITVDSTRDTDAALTAIANYLGLVAGDLNFDDGVQDLPIHFAVAERPIEAMQAVAASEMGGILYPGADGRIRFEARDSRLGTAVDQTWGDGTNVKPHDGEGYEKNPLEFYSNVTARATVFRTGQADTRIFEFSQNMFTKPTATSMAMASGEVWERTFQANSAYLALTTMVAITDYLANANIDGSGADRTGNLTPTVTDLGGGKFRLRLVATAALYVTKLQIRGQPVEFFADRAEAAFSLSVPGLKAGLSIEFDVPFAGDTGNKMRDYAYQELRVGRYFWPTLTLPFRATFDDDVAALLAAELGDLIKYKSPATNIFQTARVDDWWYVEGLEYQLPAEMFGEVFECVVTLIPSYVYRNLDAIAYDTFDRANAVGDLGTSYSGDVWSDDAGFDINTNAARANTDTLSVPDLSLAIAGASGIPLFDAASFAVQSSGTSLTFSHTVAANANRLLVVGISYRASVTPTATASGITYNGDAMTKARRDTNGDRKTEIWYLVAPDTGTHDVVVTWTADPADQVIGAASFYDVDPATPIAADAGATGNSTAPTLSVAAATNQRIVAVGATYPGGGSMTPLTPGASTTEHWEDDSNPAGVGNIQGFGGSEPGAGGATSIGWTHPGGADTWSMSALVLNPVGVYAANDHVVEVSLAAIGAGDEVGLVFRKTDASNYYRAYLDKGSNEVILEKVVGGVVTEISSPAFTVGTSHEMRVIIQATRIRVWVDRKLQIDSTDSSLTSGTKAGIMARNANGSATFKNFYCQGL
jgi:hypothetical protein